MRSAVQSAFEDTSHTVQFIDKPFYEVEEHGFDAAGVFVFDKVSREALERHQNLKLVCALSVGTDHIDLDACREHNVTVVNAPGYGSYVVAEHAFALLLTATRNIPAVLQETKNQTFTRDAHLGRKLSGKTFGVIGTGKIGRAAANIAQGFNMDVIGYDAYPSDAFKGTYKSLHETVRQADIVSLHCPLTPDTQGLLGEDEFASMKENAILINTARAGIVETDALHGWVTKTGGTALLDVYDDETFKSFNNHPNVYMTPHHAFYTAEALEAISQKTKQSVEEHMSGSDLSYNVQW